MRYLKQKNMPRRVLVMLLGIVVLGIGVGMFKLALLGNDPSTALVIAIGDRIVVSLFLLVPTDEPIVVPGGTFL